MTTVTFIRHFQTAVDPDTPVADWELSEDGHEAEAEFIDDTTFTPVTTVLSSPEPKAVHTGILIAVNADVPCFTDGALREVDRSKEGFIDDYDTYESYVEAYLTAPQVPFGWENRQDVRQRIKTTLTSMHEQQGPIIAVTHGLWLATLFGLHSDDPFQYWQNLTFGEQITVETGKLLSAISWE